MTDLDRYDELTEELNDETGYMPSHFYDKPKEERKTLRAKIQKGYEFWNDCDKSVNSTLGVIKDLESQVAKLKEEQTIFHHQIRQLNQVIDEAEEVQAKLKEGIGFEKNLNLCLKHDRDKLKSTLDEINTLVKNPSEYSNGSQSFDYINISNLEEILAKYEDNGETKRLQSNINNLKTVDCKHEDNGIDVGDAFDFEIEQAEHEDKK